MIPNQINPSENEGKIFENLRIRDTTPLQPAIPIITICGEIISTEGNLTTISGESKCGKSGFAGILISTALSENGIIKGIEELYVQPNTTGKAILHFDTEQARHTHKKNHLAILKRCGLTSCPDFFCSYNLKSLNPDEFAKVTSEICEYSNNIFNGIHLIVIDSGADYLSDFNDTIESGYIINYFEKLAIKYSVPIVIIIHTNPGKIQKEIGHLGSYFQRRSESVLTIKTDNDFSYVIPKYLRLADKKDILPIIFTFDKELGYHTGLKINNKIQFVEDSERFFTISKICTDIFKEGINLLHDQVIDSIIRKTRKSTGTANGMFKEMVAHNMITQGSDKKWKANTHYNYNEIEKIDLEG
ncbi:hypothetical protein FJ364_05265 [Candidatus Dependentiae bacterium]|nr:hypothetical protein [Candidatus Dependentiae bacterium]